MSDRAKYRAWTDREGHLHEPVFDDRGRLEGWKVHGVGPVGVVATITPDRIAAAQLQPLDLFATPPVHADPKDTERAAAERVRPKVGTLRALVLDALEQHAQGLTADEVLVWIGRTTGAEPPETSLRPRIPELARVGWVRDTGERRPNRRGSPEAVWAIVPGAGL